MPTTLPSSTRPPAAATPTSDPAPCDAAEESRSPCAMLPHLPSPSLLPAVPLSLQPLPLNALAALLGCTRSTICHFADRLGFRYTVRRIGPRHKRSACLTPEQANAVAAEVERDASSSPPQAGSEPRTKNQEPGTSAQVGHFYLLQLEPQHDPGRFKLGFSTNLECRLDDLRTVVPLAKLIAAWPCHRSWERIAIISTAQNAEPLSQEVFRCDCLEDAVEAATRFFAVMPTVEAPLLDCLTTVQTLGRSRERWFSTTDDPQLPKANISPNDTAPPSSGQSPPLPHPPPLANQDHPGTSPPIRASALTRIFRIVPNLRADTRAAPPGFPCGRKLHSTAASESPP